MQITGSRTLTRLFAFTCILLPTDNDGRPISARRWADPRQLSIRAHSTGGSEEKSTGGARRTLQAAWLWGEAPNSHHHSPQTQRTPPQVPTILPTSFSAATTAPIWNLHHSPGETHTAKSSIITKGRVKGRMRDWSDIVLLVNIDFTFGWNIRFVGYSHLSSSLYCLWYSLQFRLDEERPLVGHHRICML